jgi:hypothetical protein
VSAATENRCDGRLPESRDRALHDGLRTSRRLLGARLQQPGGSGSYERPRKRCSIRDKTSSPGTGCTRPESMSWTRWRISSSHSSPRSNPSRLAAMASTKSARSRGGTLPWIARVNRSRGQSRSATAPSPPGLRESPPIVLDHGSSERAERAVEAWRPASLSSAEGLPLGSLQQFNQVHELRSTLGSPVPHQASEFGAHQSRLQEPLCPLVATSMTGPVWRLGSTVPCSEKRSSTRRILSRSRSREVEPGQGGEHRGRRPLRLTGRGL